MYQAIFAQSPMGMVVFGNGCRVGECNAAFAGLLGYGAAELAGRDMTVLLHPDDRASFVDECARTGEDGGVIKRLLRYLHRDGEVLSVTAITTPLRDGRGRLLGFLSQIQDGSALTLADIALDHIQEAVYLIDARGRIRDVNGAACRVLGYGRDELLAMTVPDIDPNCSKRWLEENWQRQQEPGYSIDTIKTLHRTRDGRLVPVELSCVFLEHEGERYSLALARDITERALLEQAQLESEQRYRDIFDNSLDALFLLEVTEDGRFRNLAVNPAFERAVGMSREQLIGRTTDETVPAEAAAKANAKYRRCVDAGAVVDEEIELELPAGRRFFQYTLIPVHDAYGRIHRIVGIIRDITERKRAERLLLEREQEFRALVEHSPDGVVRYDRRGRRLYVNPVVERRLGVPAASLIGKSLAEAAPGHLGDSYRRHLQQVLDSGLEARAQIQGVAADGRLRFFDLSLVPEFDPDGKLASVLAVGRDITALKEAESQWRTLVENSPDFIGRYANSGRILYLNPSLCRWLGVSLEEVAGKASAEVLANAPMFDRFAACIRETVASGLPSEREFHFESLRQWHLIRFVPECDDEGRVMSVLAIGRDITCLKESDRQLRESRAHREAELEAERKRIAREVHDELGQLLTALRLNLNLACRQFGGGSPELPRRIGEMKGLVDRTISAVRSIATELRPAALDMGISSALEWLADEFSRNTGIRCGLAVDDGIELDEERSIGVFRVAQESLTNVARHAGAKAVELSLHRLADACRLTVRDDGVGFDPAGRTGYGLIGMRERALMLGGELVVSSLPRRGTQLQLEIPLVRRPERTP
ncbi:PAS domain-containing sensor histidine kinase [Zobellella iuensis]|uniref:PAS domain S-box protein n=1 Tax=Zobellella iuensis TaxID=2803811 RepID=A0ABS1QMS2_9GAMM|nr:PAS domain S-box protein [Zobellella iuensis]MBL1375781.1 PAS domain S-box protein [Zobellella iuensis]